MREHQRVEGGNPTTTWPPFEPTLHMSSRTLSFPFSLSLGVVGTSKATCLYRLFPFRTFWQKQARWHQPQNTGNFWNKHLNKAHNYMSHMQTRTKPGKCIPTVLRSTRDRGLLERCIPLHSSTVEETEPSISSAHSESSWSACDINMDMASQRRVCSHSC